MFLLKWPVVNPQAFFTDLSVKTKFTGFLIYYDGFVDVQDLCPCILNVLLHPTGWITHWSLLSGSHIVFPWSLLNCLAFFLQRVWSVIHLQSEQTLWFLSYISGQISLILKNFSHRNRPPRIKDFSGVFKKTPCLLGLLKFPNVILSLQNNSLVVSA